MYSLPEDIDLDFLKDKKLIQICISQHQIIMRFEDDISISIESVIKLLTDNGESHIYEGCLSINKAFLELFGISIISVIRNASGILIILFENGSKIELADDSVKYESYQIVRDGQIIVTV